MNIKGTTQNVWYGISFLGLVAVFTLTIVQTWKMELKGISLLVGALGVCVVILSLYKQFKRPRI